MRPKTVAAVTFERDLKAVTRHLFDWGGSNEIVQAGTSKFGIIMPKFSVPL